MEAARTRRGIWQVGLVSLLLALAMRLLVPTGFMWDTAPNGSAQLVPCSGTAPTPAAPAAHAMHHMAMAGQQHERGHEGGHTSSHECAFAGLAGALDLADTFATPVAPLLATAALAILWSRAATPGRGLAAPPPPSRGPPATL